MCQSHGWHDFLSVARRDIERLGYTINLTVLEVLVYLESHSSAYSTEEVKHLRISGRLEMVNDVMILSTYLHGGNSSHEKWFHWSDGCFEVISSGVGGL